MAEWISVKDRLPKPRYGNVSKDVLTIDEHKIQRILCHVGTGWVLPNCEPRGSRAKITHWMPLPQPPSGN